MNRTYNVQRNYCVQAWEPGTAQVTLIVTSGIYPHWVEIKFSLLKPDPIRVQS